MKQIIIDKITKDGQIQIKEVTTDAAGNETNHRWVLAPGDNLAGQDPKIVAAAQTAWTPAILAAWKARQDALIDRTSHLSVGGARGDAVKTKKTKFKAQTVSRMNPADIAAIVEMLCQLAGVADENGALLPPT